VNSEVQSVILAAKEHIQNEVLALEMNFDATLALGENDLGLSTRLRQAN
jgi:hypothetical protein